MLEAGFAGKKELWKVQQGAGGIFSGHPYFLDWIS